MKKLTTIFASMLVCVLSLASFTSCSDDDDDDAPAAPAAREVSGTYTNDMTCTVMGQESVFENLTVSVAAVDDATVNVVLPSFGNPPMQLPSITIEGVKVSGTNGTYTLAETTFKGETSDGKAYSGTFSGSYASGTLKFQFNLQYGSMPMPMICSFTAPKK